MTIVQEVPADYVARPREPHLHHLVAQELREPLGGGDADTLLRAVVLQLLRHGLGLADELQQLLVLQALALRWIPPPTPTCVKSTSSQ